MVIYRNVNWQLIVKYFYFSPYLFLPIYTTFQELWYKWNSTILGVLFDIRPLIEILSNLIIRYQTCSYLFELITTFNYRQCGQLYFIYNTVYGFTWLQYTLLLKKPSRIDYKCNATLLLNNCRLIGRFKELLVLENRSNHDELQQIDRSVVVNWT